MKKLILSLLLLIPSISFADTATTGNPKLILVSTGSVDRTRSWGDKVNENFSIISASMSTLFSGGVGGGSQSSFAGSKATSAVEMGGFGINNSSGLTLGTGGKITFPDGTTQNTASVGGGGGGSSLKVVVDSGTVFNTVSTMNITQRDFASAFTGSTFTLALSTNVARLDGSSQTFNMGSGIFQINSRELYTRGTTIGFITGVTGQENQFLIKGSASNSNRTFALDRNLSLTGWSLQDYATTVPASYQDIYLNPLGGDIGIATTSAVTPLDVKGTIKSTLLSDYGIMDYWAFGDSITAGAQATSSAFRYPNIIAEKMGYNLHNLGFSGAVLEETGIIDNVFATPVTSQTVSSILIGYNNSRYYAYDIARSTMFEASLNSALVYLALPYCAGKALVRKSDLSRLLLLSILTGPPVLTSAPK
jgi:hypothetical protein